MCSLPNCSEFPTKTGEIFRNATGRYSFMCFNCGIIFEDFAEIINHCESHFKEEKYDISVHPLEFVLGGVSDETESIQNANSFPDESIKVDKKKSSLNVNTKIRTKLGRTRKKRVNVMKRLPNIPQNCPLCELWCDDFGMHMKNVHNLPNRIIQCYKCKRFFMNFTSVKNHLNRWNHITNHCYHCEMEPAVKHASEPRRHKCQFCKEWFSNHVEFKSHFKDAHNKDADYFFHKRANCNIFTCYVCEREFPLRYYLVAHMRKHYDKFLCHTCPTCGKRCRTHGILTQHLKTHEGKTFSCDQCDKQFAYYARLRIHRSSHSTELKFKCEFCPKVFKLRKYLQTHTAIHKNERKYRCKFCDASFNFTSGRRAHEKGHHGAL